MKLITPPIWFESMGLMPLATEGWAETKTRTSVAVEAGFPPNRAVKWQPESLRRIISRLQAGGQKPARADVGRVVTPIDFGPEHAHDSTVLRARVRLVDVALIVSLSMTACAARSASPRTQLTSSPLPAPTTSVADPGAEALARFEARFGEVTEIYASGDTT